MIRGINKKVIEIKNCDSAYFERAFLIVKNEKTNVSDDLLNFNAELFVRNISMYQSPKKQYTNFHIDLHPVTY